MFDRLALVRYALEPDPASSLPSSVLLSSTDQTITIFDLFPKAKYHFLVIPRTKTIFNGCPGQMADADGARALGSLRGLLTSCDQATVQHVLVKLRDATEEVRTIVEEEMYKATGRTWPLQIGFHAIESLPQIHLHVMSTDLVSDKLKTKRHYNSFRPDLGFFIHLQDIISRVQTGLLSLPKSEAEYEDLLKTPLESIETGEKFKTMPQLKAHLLTRSTLL